MISRFLSLMLLAASLCVFPVGRAATPAAAAPPAAQTKVFPTTPTLRPDGKRWRIGYVESGIYGDYPLTLGEIVKGLQHLGWLKLKGSMPKGASGQELWAWLAQNTDSKYLEFVPDAWWQPGNFDAAQRPAVRDAIKQRLTAKRDIDLIIAMGTWAGQDMAAMGTPVPTIVASTSDAIGARITRSAQDSGQDNLHARVQP